MTEIEFTVSYLSAVQKKHRDYFTRARISIMKCVRIRGDKKITVDVVKKDLPAEIKYDIESMFWLQ